MTGSGIYLEAIIRESQKQGFLNYWVAGVPANRIHPLKEFSQIIGSCVFFESESLDFPVTGMSDVMPYKSSLFKELKGKRLTSYKSEFTRVLQAVEKQFDPDIIHTNHHFLLSAFVRKLFPNVTVVATCHGTDLRQYNNCPHLRCYVKRLRSLMKIQNHDWHLHMAGSGDGPEFSNCIELAKKLGRRATNHGYVTHHRLAELMKMAHVQVLPSFFEGLPLVLFEGPASGCRIITTNLSGFQEIFGSANSDTINLIQLPPLKTIDRPYQKDEAQLEKELCQSILSMIAAVKKSPDFDDPQAEKIAANFTWPCVFQRTLAVYNDALRQHARSDWLA